jgi:uncharacterized protein YcnI
MRSARRLAVTALATCAASTYAVQLAAAHVIVQPAETTTGRLEHYTVIVPTERGFATVSVQLEVPRMLNVVSYEQTPGWTVTANQSVPIGPTIEVTWSGGKIDPGHFTTFSFYAWNPARPARVVWRAVQIYADTTRDAWQDPAHPDTPASVTEIRAAPPGEAAAGGHLRPDAFARAAPGAPGAAAPATREPTGPGRTAAAALVVALLALLVALVALGRAVRR